MTHFLAYAATVGFFVALIGWAFVLHVTRGPRPPLPAQESLKELFL